LPLVSVPDHGNNKGREDPCRKTDVGRRFSCALPVIFGVTEPVWLPKTSYCTFGHDHILKCPNVQWTSTHLDKDMDPVRGRKSYFVHNMRQDVAILCSKSNTNSLFRGLLDSAQKAPKTSEVPRSKSQNTVCHFCMNFWIFQFFFLYKSFFLY
jgi:hypothetical protein